MHVLTELFGSYQHLDAAQECARAVVIFIYGLAMVRIAGRRVFGKWSALDTIVSIVVGSNLSRALTGTAPLAGTLASTTLLFALHWLLAHAAARWSPVSRLLEGKAVVLTQDGELRESSRVRSAVSEADLYEALRRNGVDRPQDAGRVTIEPSGRITVLKAKPN